MKKAVSVLFCLALVFGAGQLLLAEDVDVSGAWKMTSQGRRGERVSEITLVQDGEKLAVTSKDRDGNDVTSEGTVKAQDITWTVKRQTERGEIVITYTGKIEGQTIKGTSTFTFGPEGESRTGEWKAEKLAGPGAAPAATPAATPAAPKTETPKP